jgi:hypothetical protein
MAPGALRMRLQPFVLLGVFLVCTRIGEAVELKPETIDAFDHYIVDLEMRLEPRFHGVHFLWSDDSPGLREQLAQGAVLVRPANGNGLIAVKSGLIQDWMGVVFIPHCTLKTVLAMVQDYDRHQEILKPDIALSKTRVHRGDDFEVYLRIVKTKFFLSDVLNSEHKIHFAAVDAQRVYSRNYTTRIAEVNGVGKAGEHELPVGQDRGLLWRLYSYWFYEERDGGVYIACQTVTLTRDIPLGMGRILGPIVRDVPGESLQASLEQIRKAVGGLPAH